MPVYIRRINGYDVYIHSSIPHGPVTPSGYLHLTPSRPGNPIISCLSVDCNSCPIGLPIRQATFGVSDMTCAGCTSCAEHILRGYRIYRRPSC